MQSIEFISFDEDNNPQKKIYKGKHIDDLLLNENEIGQIIQECMFGTGKVNIKEDSNE